MLPARRAAVIAIILVLTPLLAGCNASLWLKQQSVVNIWVAPQPASKSALNDFQTLKLGVLSIAVRQGQDLQPQNFAFNGDPKVLDMVQGGNPQPVKVVSTTMSLRAISAITVRVEGEDAVRARGDSLQWCYPGKPGVKEPCVSIPQNGGYVIDNHPVVLARGNTVDVYFPLSVQFDGTEYFIQTDSALLRQSTE
jgi:hypothetical protein